MFSILREFLVRSDDGEEKKLCECLVETDTTTNHNVGTRSEHRRRYYRECDGGMHAQEAVEIEEGIFKMDNGKIYREIESG